MIIKKIFNKEFDEEVHSDFLKFGKGEFPDKYLIEAKKQKDRWVIKTGSEWANHLVKRVLQNVSGNIKMTGVIVSTFDLRTAMGGFVFNQEEEVKQFMGIKQLKVNSEISSSKILEIMEKFPRAFFALSFSVNGNDLKIKAKAPKSAKPATSGEKGAKAEFCSLKTSDLSIIKDIFFDFPSFKEISIRHTIKVDSIVYPQGFQTMKPEEVRIKSKRKGVVVRNILIDGKQEVREAEFVA